jgi:hypothetical protein
MIHISMSGVLIPALRTIFGLKDRLHRNRKNGPPVQDIMIEEPQYGPGLVRDPLRVAAAECLHQG